MGCGSPGRRGGDAVGTVGAVESLVLPVRAVTFLLADAEGFDSARESPIASRWLTRRAGSTRSPVLSLPSRRGPVLGVVDPAVDKLSEDRRRGPRGDVEWVT